MPAGELHAQLYVDYYLDPKFDNLSAPAERLYIRALCLSKRLMSDGKLTVGQLRALKLQRLVTAAEELCNSGLWQIESEGDSQVYVIKSYLRRNKSRSQIEELSKRRKDAAQKGNHDRWHKDKPRNDCPYCHYGTSQIGSQIGSQNDPVTDSNIDRDIDRDRDNQSDEQNNNQSIKRAARIIAQKRLANSNGVMNPDAWLTSVAKKVEIEMIELGLRGTPEEIVAVFDKPIPKRTNPLDDLVEASNRNYARHDHPCLSCEGSTMVEDENGLATKCLACRGSGIAKEAS